MLGAVPLHVTLPTLLEGRLNYQRDALRKQFWTWEVRAGKGRRDTNPLSSGVFCILQRRVTHIPFLNQTLLGPQALHEAGNAIASYSAPDHSAAQVPPSASDFSHVK